MTIDVNKWSDSVNVRRNSPEATARRVMNRMDTPTESLAPRGSAHEYQPWITITETNNLRTGQTLEVKEPSSYKPVQASKPENELTFHDLKGNNALSINGVEFNISAHNGIVDLTLTQNPMNLAIEHRVTEHNPKTTRLANDPSTQVPSGLAGSREVAAMLVLSRQRDESIIIGDNIVITVVDIRGDKVRLGIEANKEVPVHRREVYEAIQREDRRTRQTGDTVAEGQPTQP